MLLDRRSMSSYSDDLLELAYSSMTNFHGGVSVCCTRCMKDVFRVGEMPWENQNMKPFEAAKYCLKSIYVGNTLVLVPHHVLLLDAGMILRASNVTIGVNTFHSPLSPIDDKFCKDCCLEMNNEGKQMQDMESIKMKYSEVQKRNVDMMKSLRDAKKCGIKSLLVQHQCDCKNLCVERTHICKSVITGNYSLNKMATGSANNLLRVIFVPSGTSGSTDREGLQIWIMNTTGANAVRYSEGAIKANRHKKFKQVSISSALLSQKLVTDECLKQSYTNTCTFSNDVIYVSDYCEDLKCAACGQGTFGQGVLANSLPRLQWLLPFAQMRPMVWMQGFFNTYHLDTCVQTCAECDNTLVPRYGASQTQLDGNAKAKCVPLDCAWCVAKKKLIQSDKKEEVLHEEFNEQMFPYVNEVRDLECDFNLQERNHKRIKIHDDISTSKSFLIYCNFLPLHSIQSAIASGSIASIPRLTKHPHDYDAVAPTTSTNNQDMIEFPRVVYDD